MRKDKKIEKILEDILKLEPELKSNSKKLEETLEILSNLNPNIKASKEFKKELKLKIDNIIGLKKDSNSHELEKIGHNYLKILISLFSGVFAIFGLFYFLGNTIFYTGDEGQKVLQTIKLSGEPEDLIIRDEIIIDSRLEEKLNNTIFKKEKINSSPNVLIDLNSEEKTIKKIEQVIDNPLSEQPEQIILENTVDTVKDSSEENQEEAISIQNINLENLDSIEIKGKISLDYSNEEDSVGINNTSEILDSDIDYGFVNYCNSIGGIFKEETVLCILDNKNCNKEDYDIGNCPELLEIKNVIE